MTEKTKKIIHAVAAKNGVSPEHVENEMKKAVRLAMTSEDSNVQTLWKQLAPDGKEPELDAVLDFLIERMYLQ